MKYAPSHKNRASGPPGLCYIRIPFCAWRQTCTLDVRGGVDRWRGRDRGTEEFAAALPPRSLKPIIYILDVC